MSSYLKKNTLEVKRSLEKIGKEISQLKFLCLGYQKKRAIKYELPKRPKKRGGMEGGSL